MSQMSEFIRKTFEEGDNIRDAGLTTPEGIARYDGILYGTSPDWQVLDVYRPKRLEGEILPVIVSVHGGAWVYGDKERYQFYCMDLALRGFAVVNFTYRLAPAFQFSSPLEDTNLVFDWVLKNAGVYNFDTENIFAVGDSAGAHILGMYAAMTTNPEYAREYPFQKPEELRLKAIALNCGLWEIHLNGDENDMIQAVMYDYLPEKGSQKEQSLLSIVNHVSEDYPPAFIVTAAGDFLKAQAPIMAAALVKKNVPFVLEFYGNQNNPLSHVFHLNIRSQDAKLCNDRECEFFRRYMRQAKEP